MECKMYLECLYRVFRLSPNFYNGIEQCRNIFKAIAFIFLQRMLFTSDDTLKVASASKNYGAIIYKDVKHCCP